VKVIDVNLLLYAVNRDSPKHAEAKGWLERTLTADEPVALPWAVILGFVRIATSARVFKRPLSADEAIGIVDGWLALDSVAPLSPSDDHWRLVKELLAETGTAGNLTTDAHLAALAIESDAELCSTDTDFGRFRRLRWANPLAAPDGA
jgi:toxin-antitoxin system PIN domain toxin